MDNDSNNNNELNTGEQTIRAKWLMDGATTLTKAADMLRTYATELEQLEKDGWQLTGEVVDDYGFITRFEQ